MPPLWTAKIVEFANEMPVSAPEAIDERDFVLQHDAKSTAPPVTNGSQSGLKGVCDALARQVNEFLEEEPETQLLKDVQTQTRIAMGAIQESFEKYSLEEISLSYNGGKDCLVLLILFLAALSTSKQPLPEAVQSVYIISEHPFQEVDDFVDLSISTYFLDLARYAMQMKEGFGQYLEDKKNSGREIKAIFVGTRRTDPHGAKLTHFDMTDGGWPRFMRVHPVIDWHYVEIWTFIRHLKIPYCPLYDMGYTSLGGTTDTHPNPALKGTEQEGKKTFRPAYELTEDNAERLGRDR